MSGQKDASISIRWTHTQTDNTGPQACKGERGLIVLTPLRNLGAGAQTVLDHLLADRTSALTPADISERFGHDASPGTPLHMALAANDKIEVLPDGAFTYKVPQVALASGLAYSHWQMLQSHALLPHPYDPAQPGTFRRDMSTMHVCSIPAPPVSFKSRHAGGSSRCIGLQSGVPKT